MRENKQAILDSFCKTLQLTSNAGDPSGNRLEHLLYIPEREVVRPIFADGTGKDGYYDVCVACDSGTAMIYDVCRNFVNHMW